MENKTYLLKRINNNPIVERINGFYGVEPYNFNEVYRGKFVVSTNSVGEFLTSVGENKEEANKNLGHELVAKTLDNIDPSSKGSEVKAGGYLTILPDDKLAIFFGESAGYKKGFTREQVLPHAYNLYSLSKGAIDKAVLLESLDYYKKSELKGLVGKIIAETLDSRDQNEEYMRYIASRQYDPIDLKEGLSGGKEK